MNDAKLQESIETFLLSKESRIPHNTRINTPWAVRVLREWAEERNEIGALPKVNPDILNITGNDELKVNGYVRKIKVVE